MTIKPERTVWEADKEKAKLRYLEREQEENETKRAIRDFLRHYREELEEEKNNGYAPPR